MKKSCFYGLDKTLESLLKKGVEQGVFSGAAAGVFTNIKDREEKLVVYAGKTRKDDLAVPVTDRTLFDLASLTKPLCTVQLILYLIQTKKISLDLSLESVFEKKKGQCSNLITLAHLLSHSSGMKAYTPFYLNFPPVQDKNNKDKLLNDIFTQKPDYQPGLKCIYSDLGYMVLGAVVEKVSEEKLNNVFAKKITGPLGLEKKLLFLPVDKFGGLESREIAATQDCPWRKRILQGEVDDEHCWLMNGVAGHAGLFGSLSGVLEMTSHILKQWQKRVEHPSYSNKLLQNALRKHYRSESWCLGFDTPSPTGSSGGGFISKKSVGHLGFTGTSFWIDPERALAIVLLTNRVHPSRANERIKEFRPLFHDTIYKHLL